MQICGGRGATVYVFFVFGVQYPQKLRVFFSFVEFVMDVSGTAVIPSVRDLVRELNAPAR